MATSQAKTALRQFRRENALCIHCGAGADNGTRCVRCTEKDHENRRRYQERAKQSGVCITLGCPESAREGRVYCAVCARRQADSERRRKASGVCLKCKNIATAGGYCGGCREKRNAYMKAYHRKRIEEGKCPRCGDFRMDDKLKLCESCTKKSKRYRVQLKLEVMNAYGGPVCVGCGEDEPLILQIDHTNGGGSEHSREIGGRGKMYSWLKENGFPRGYRVLCPSCNVRAARGLAFPKKKC